MKTVKQVTFATLGLIFLVIGLAGVVLPILPGILLIAAGLVFISFEIPSLDLFLKRQAAKNTKLEYYYNKIYFWLYKKIK
jgi:uncharacterized membrane protein YbaN (DUF454 family)